MKKIKTAEELFDVYFKSKTMTGAQLGSVKSAMIEFAKMHVEAALKAASKEGKIIDEDGDTYHQPHVFYCNGEEYKNWIDKDSILNAYPENNIK